VERKLKSAAKTSRGRSNSSCAISVPALLLNMCREFLNASTALIKLAHAKPAAPGWVLQS